MNSNKDFSFWVTFKGFRLARHDFFFLKVFCCGECIFFWKYSAIIEGVTLGCGDNHKADKIKYNQCSDTHIRTHTRVCSEGLLYNSSVQPSHLEEVLSLLRVSI